MPKAIPPPLVALLTGTIPVSKRGSFPSMESSGAPLPGFCRQWGSSGPFPFPGNHLDDGWGFTQFFFLIQIFKIQSKWLQLFGKYFTKSECVCSPIRICWVRERDLSPSLAVSGFWLFPVSPNLRPVLGTNGPAQGAYLGKDSSNGNFREMVEISTTTMQIQFHMRLQTT